MYQCLALYIRHACSKREEKRRKGKERKAQTRGREREKEKTGKHQVYIHREGGQNGLSL